MTDKNIKKQLPRILRFLIKLFQIILYIPIQIIFIPFAIIGLIVAVYKEMLKSKKLGISFTSIQALQYRWLMHYFNTRPDPPSIAFTKKLPCESHFGLLSTFGALIISQRLFGFTTRFGKLIKYKESGRLVKTEKEWIIGDGSLKEINTPQIENMNGIARGSQSHLVRKTKGFAKKVRRLTKHYGFFQMYRNFMWTDKNGMTQAMKEDLSDLPMTWDVFLHPNYQA